MSIRPCSAAPPSGCWPAATATAASNAIPSGLKFGCAGRRDRRLHHLGADGIGPVGHRRRGEALVGAWPQVGRRVCCSSPAASTALNAKQQDEGRKLLEKLAKTQADDGHLDSRQGSITRSGGQSLQVETTALAALAWLKSPEFAVAADRAVKWIVAHREGGGGFGSTQATILALKAMVEHAKANRRTANAGTLTIERDGRTLGQHSFSAGHRDVIAIDGLEAALVAGDNRLTINLTGDNKLPYMLNVSYRTLKPESTRGLPRATDDQVGQHESQGWRDGRALGRTD